MKYIITICLICFQFESLIAQDIKTYSGPYEAVSFQSGTATYEYYENDNNERIYHGSFRYEEGEYEKRQMEINKSVEG